METHNSQIRQRGRNRSKAIERVRVCSVQGRDRLQAVERVTVCLVGGGGSQRLIARSKERVCSAARGGDQL